VKSCSSCYTEKAKTKRGRDKNAWDEREGTGGEETNKVEEKGKETKLKKKVRKKEI
jgi:hypothetical protein